MPQRRFSKEDFEDVYATARMAHMGQKRRSGQDYLSHPSAVRNLARRYYPSDKEAQLVALLHDTLEDGPRVGNVSSKEEMRAWIRASVADQSAAKEILDSVEMLTHEEGIRYDVYLSSLLGNPLAIRVKLLDMLHNLTTSPTERQANKYKSALGMLEDVANGLPPSISRKHWSDLKLALEAVTESNTADIRMLIRELMFE